MDARLRLRVRRPFAVVCSWTLDSGAGQMIIVVKKKGAISKESQQAKA